MGLSTAGRRYYLTGMRSLTFGRILRGMRELRFTSGLRPTRIASSFFGFLITGGQASKSIVAAIGSGRWPQIHKMHCYAFATAECWHLAAVAAEESSLPNQARVEI